VIKDPKVARVYNIGGGRTSNCSMLEAITLSEEISGKKLDSTYVDDSRIGDHIWWISDNGKFMSDYPNWRVEKSIKDILTEIYNVNKERWVAV
jgi:CDP-paratose 2-epimerase